MPSEHLTPGQFSAAISAVTNAFGDPTRRAIYLMAREEDAGVTATEAAERFDLHPNVARHHLDKLAAGGYLEVTVPRDHPGAGRPSKRYKASAKDTGLDFGARRDDLLVTLLGRALSLLTEGQAAEMAEEVGFSYGRSLAEQMAPGDTAHRSFQHALHAVADALTAHGFAAHAEARGGSLAIISEQCPFGATATSHPVVCAVDRGMVRGMLAGLYGDTVPATEASRPQGDDVCVTVV
ncbi:MAG: putative transcriptional regulator [Acidimicrobiales bacterium]|nr:putative transcriptional regulator [Acidimicrobiales bacterium]